MDKKHSNLDEEMNRGIAALRHQPVPGQAALRAEREVAWGAKGKADRRMRIALRLAGVAGTAAVAALALWPKPGEGLAWAQVVDRTVRAARVHEKVEISMDGQWRPFIERWTDGNRGRGLYQAKGKMVYETRYDGKRQYSSFGPQSYGIVRTTPLHEKKSFPAQLWAFGIADTTIDQMLLNKEAKLVEKRDVELPSGKKGILYRLEYPGMGTTTSNFFTAYVEPETGHVLSWESGNSSTSPFNARGTVDYPTAIDPKNFEVPPSDVPADRVFDIDALRPELDRRLVRGLGALSVGGVRARLRIVLAEQGRLWVFWDGTPPNGELTEPIRVRGLKVGQAMGEPNFTTTRPLIADKFQPSPILKSPLAGFVVEIKGKIPPKVDLEVPLYQPDRSKPIRDKAGKIVGYRSRFVGYAKADNVPVMSIPEIHIFAKSLGFARKGRTDEG